jgi:predicted PurR-regulated permease PerM
MKNSSVRFAAVLFIIAISITGVYFLHPVLVPLLLAFLFAILLRPVVAFFNYKLKLPHVLAVSLTVMLAVLAGIGILFFITKQVSGFSEDIPNIKRHLNMHYHSIQNWVHEKFNVSYRKQDNYVQKVTNETFQSENDLMGNTLDRFSTILLTALLLPVYTFLILLYRNLFMRFFTKLLHVKHHPVLKDIMCEIKIVVRSFIVGLLLEMIIVATMISTGLMIVGVEYAIFLGVVTALLNLVPYLGIFTSLLLSMTVTLGNSTELHTLIGVLLVFTITHLTDGNILIPRVVSSKIKINALVAMVGVVSGGMLIGIPGMFLALPVLAILKVIFDRIPGLEPWGYILGDTMPKTFDWYLLKLPDLKVGNEEEEGTMPPTDAACKETPKENTP